MKKIAPALLVGTLVMATGVAVWDALWIAAMKGPSRAELDHIPAAPGAADAPQDLAQIAAWPLFGRARSDEENANPGAMGPRSAPPPGQDLPPSSAPYRLFGLITSYNRADRRAFLGEDQAKQRAFREGDIAPDGAQIMAIEEGKVVLSRAGMPEALELPREFPSGLPAEVDAADSAQALLPEASNNPDPDQAPLPGAANNPTPAAQKMLERLRQRVAANRARQTAAPPVSGAEP